MITKKTLIFSASLFAATSLLAQDIYKMETFAGSDLNGTARFVGMGGAMNALGADISVINTNPAGIGMFRRSDVSFSAGFNVQPNGQEFYDIGKARPSFDQAGFVYSHYLGNSGARYLNFAFNYHKSRNFKNYIGVNGFNTGGLSQSLQMMDLCYVNNRWLDLTNENDADLTTNLTYAGFQTQMIAPTYNAAGELTGYDPSVADYYNYKRVQWGGIQNYDFNISTNWNDQIYLGLNLGVKNVNFHSYTDYAEFLPDNTGQHHKYYTTNEEAISGSGVDFQLGVIARPTEGSPLRIALSFSTPTFYNLRTNSYLYMNSPYALYDDNGTQISDYTEYDIPTAGYEYNITTPWRVNIGLGLTVDKFLAMDAEYEYSNYGSCKVSYGGYDDWGNPTLLDRDKDVSLNQEAKHFMKGVHTFRFGAEARFSKSLYARFGYNAQSAPMKKEAYLNLFTNSPSYYYSNNTDYVNLGRLDRYTCGLGYRGKHFYIDAAYQAQIQQGDLYTFHVPQSGSEANRLEGAKVDLNRHSGLVTIGYKF